jgi:hypothetical protein
MTNCWRLGCPNNAPYPITVKVGGGLIGQANSCYEHLPDPEDVVGMKESEKDVRKG